MNSITENPFLRNIHAKLRERLRIEFTELSECPHDSFLFLSKYLDICPCKFYNVEVYEQMKIWLFSQDASNQSNFIQYIEENNLLLSNALLHLDEINSFSWHDTKIPINDIDQLKFIDQLIHPAYLRLTEGVLTPLLHPVAYFSRLDRVKGVDGLDIWNIIEEVKNTRLKDAIIGYNSLMRNGIAHGGITYLENEIKYIDKRGNEDTIFIWDVMRTFDNLLDVCNSLAFALSLFLLLKETKGYKLPQEVLYEELKASCKLPFWNVDACIPTETLKGTQLVIYTTAKTRDYDKVKFSSFQTGILAAILSKGYDRYFVSIKSEIALPGWAAFDGKKISQLAKNRDFSVLDCGDILEDGLVFYVPKFKLPKLLSFANTFIISFKVHASLFALEFQNNMGSPIIEIRNISIHRNGWRLVLKGEVVIYSKTININKEIIYSSLRRIVRKSVKKAKREYSFFHLFRYLPLGFVYLSIFKNDYRKRRLSSFGLGSDLICTIRILRIKRIKQPDIFGSTIEERGKYRIAWNKSWLEFDH